LPVFALFINDFSPAPFQGLPIFRYLYRIQMIMKKALFLTGLLWSLATAAQTGYEMQVTLKTFTNQ